MFLDWSLLTIVTIIALFLFFQVLFYKNVVENEEKSITTMKATLREAEILIRKYQIQLQRALGNVDILSEELNKLKNEMKVLKQRNSKHRQEVERLNNKIKALEGRIEALL